ncbi:MAG: AAA family ATPase [Neobacillus sp.]
MFIKSLELTNFKCHTSTRFEFGKTNHFFGDNYTGKSSIGDAIVFNLFGVTKHGFKGYTKDYLQAGQNSMKVDVVFQMQHQEFLLTRTMNSKGTTTVYLNTKKVKESEVKQLLGDYSRFIYCFFPEVFPEEEKSIARSYIIKSFLAEKDAFYDLEKEKSRIIKQQKDIESSKTFYEGQKSVLKRQIESLNGKQKITAAAIPPETQIKRQQLKEEVKSITIQLEGKIREGIELKTKLSTLKEKKSEPYFYISEQCPTCHQTVSNSQTSTIQLEHEKKKNALQNEIDFLEKELEEQRRQYSNLAKNKTILEEELEQIKKAFPSEILEHKPGQQLIELEKVELIIADLLKKKADLAENLKNLKHQLGQLANQYQNQINQYFTYTKVELFKQLKNGELRPDFQITYKNRPYRVLSNSEKIRCMLEIIAAFNQNQPNPFPIFLDNLESITHLSQPATQIFTATVKKELPLTLKVKD